MKNPLRKRLWRQLKKDFGKYIAIFLFIVLFVGLMSGFIVTNGSVMSLYEKSWETYNVEDGHITFESEPPAEIMETLAKDNDLKFYELFYKEEDTRINDKARTLRIYQKRDKVDLECIMEGRFPEKADEIAVDRTFAENNSVKTGDKITIDSKVYTIVGKTAFVDYSSLYESNSDMMFDAVNFGVAVMSEEGFDSVSDAHLSYNYAWKYNTPCKDDTDANTRSEAFIDSLEDNITDYDEKVIQAKVDSLYGEIKVSVNNLKAEFTAAADEIESKTEKASVAAAEKAVNSLTDEEKYAVIEEMTGMTEEDIENKLIESLGLTSAQKAKLLLDSSRLSEEELMAEVYEMTGLTEEALMEKVIEISGLTEDEIGEALMKKAAEKQGTTVMGLVAAELGTDEASLQELSDMFDGEDGFTDDFELPEEAPKIDLDSEEETEADSLDFDFDSVYEILDKIDKTGLYDTTEIRASLASLEKLTDSLDLNGKDIVNISAYLPGYLNQAVIYCGSDGSGDEAGAGLMVYMMFAVLAFVFAVTTSNTITKEAGVIGTLRASGYTRGELLRHYIALPIVVSLVASVIGNILGYTVCVGIFEKVYYTNYSLPTFVVSYSSEAFIKTTVIPLIMMLVINLIVIASKLRISPLNFLRGDLSRKGRKKAMKLSSKLRFFSRFRLRILFKNIPAYVVLFFGLLLGGMFMVFSLMFGPLINDYSELAVETQIAPYQYILSEEKETETEGAEKFAVTSLDTMDDRYVTDSVMIYGVEENSSYVKTDIPEGEVIVSNSLMDKFDCEPGDEITLKETYSNKTYTFKIAGEYTYYGAIAIFMNHDDYVEKFDESKNFFNGYFSNTEIKDIDTENIATTITKQDMLKMVDQMSVSMLGLMDAFMYLGIAVFLLLSYLMTKQIIEKSAGSISMTKILGFRNSEIARLYLLITTFVVIVSLLLSVPVINELLRFLFKSYMYSEMAGYIPFIISDTVYVKMVIMGLVSYFAVAALMLIKINKVPKGMALKNQNL